MSLPHRASYQDSQQEKTHNKEKQIKKPGNSKLLFGIE